METGVLAGALALALAIAGRSNPGRFAHVRIIEVTLVSRWVPAKPRGLQPRDEDNIRERRSADEVLVVDGAVLRLTERYGGNGLGP